MILYACMCFVLISFVYFSAYHLFIITIISFTSIGCVCVCEYVGMYVFECELDINALDQIQYPHCNIACCTSNPQFNLARVLLVLLDVLHVGGGDSTLQNVN